MEFKERKIIDKIYEAKQEELDEIIKQKMEQLKIEKNLESFNNVNDKKVEDVFNDLEEYYNIKISFLIKEFYKEGFIDGVNLMMNCLGENNSF